MADDAGQTAAAAETTADPQVDKVDKTDPQVDKPSEPEAVEEEATPEPLPPVEIALHKDYQCAYCFDMRDYMEDKRMLPCGHVFCGKCLDGNLRAQAAEDFFCPHPHCNTKQEWKTLDELPRVEVTTPVSVVVEERVKTKSPCEENHQACNRAAAHYCVTCDIQMCQQYFNKAHEAYVKNKGYGYAGPGGAGHRVIEIRVYLAAPDRYHDKRHCCETHTDKQRLIRQACGKCGGIFCKKCEPAQKKCPDGSSHDITTLEETSKNLEREYEKLKEKLNAKSAEIENQKKTTWRELYWISDRHLEMCAEVDRITREQVNEIYTKAQAVKEEIIDFLKASVDQVEKYCTDLDRRRDEVKELFRTTIEHLKQDHDTVRVKEYNDRMAKINELGSQVINPCPLKTMDLQPKDLCREVERKTNIIDKRPPLIAAA